MAAMQPARSLVGFKQGSAADYNSTQQSTDADEESPAPSVLNKLQKWADYEAMGSPVSPTRFIPMKTPMSNEILDSWSLPKAPRHALTVALLLKTQANLGRRVGLVIDLANHDCLYSDDMPEALKYEHVQLIAKVLPSREAINEVERIARSFWGEHPDNFIAIHCAYGFNRTGFVVCSYLCQACGLSVEQALENFAAARPPGVKHEKFIRELYARYGSSTASLATTPESASLLGASPPLVDALAAEAEWLRQHGAAAAVAAATCTAASYERILTGAGSTATTGMGGQAIEWYHRQQQQREEEDQHFEDAADMVRRVSQHRRSLSQRSSGGDALQAGSSSPVTGSSCAISGCSSRNPSWHGGSLAAELAGVGELEAADGRKDVSVATVAGVGVSASRKLLLHGTSRGGGLSQALTGSSPRPLGSSPGSSGSLTAGGNSPVSGGRTGTSSMSDFAAAAMHLEGRNSMRRSTTLVLAKAVSEDFLQQNDNSSAAAPIAAAGAWDAEQLGPWSLPADNSESCQSSEHVEQQQQPQQQQQQEGPADGNTAVPASSGSWPVEADAVAVMAMVGACSTCCVAACDSGNQYSSPPKESQSGNGQTPLGSSPSRRGGIPLPPVRAVPHAHMSFQQHLQHLLQQQPGTPATPASSTTPSVIGGSSSQWQGNFPRSVSVDSDNPSLGFGIREALHHLRVGTMAGGTNVRGPEALADLFREDSQGELSTLDVDEHLEALAQAAGTESPAANVTLPRVVEAALAEARRQDQPGGALSEPQPPPLQLGPPAQCGCAADAAGGGSTLQMQQQQPVTQQEAGGAAAVAAPPGGQPFHARYEQGRQGGTCLVM